MTDCKPPDWIVIDDEETLGPSDAADDEGGDYGDAVAETSLERVRRERRQRSRRTTIGVAVGLIALFLAIGVVFWLVMRNSDNHESNDRFGFKLSSVDGDTAANLPQESSAPSTSSTTFLRSENP